MMKPTTITILRAVAEHGPVATRDIDALKLPGFANGCKSHLGVLYRTLEMIEPWDFQDNRQRYVVSAKGEKLLRALDAAAKVPEGQMPEPRTAPPSGEWKPPKMSPPRANSDAHEKCPSVRNGERVAWSPPISNAGRAMTAIGLHGGVL